jgi:hypothetical protein
MASVDYSHGQREAKARDRSMKAQLVSQLKGLPEPEYTYEISVPDIGDEAEDDDNCMSKKPEDAAEVAMRSHEHVDLHLLLLLLFK